MIVHEALSPVRSARLNAAIEHRFASAIPERGQKEEMYALLWAVRAYAEQRRSKVALVQRPALFMRDAVFKGALLRGGAPAARLAWAVARYHSRKYERLDELRGGEHADIVAAYAEGNYARVFELCAEVVARLS